MTKIEILQKKLEKAEEELRTQRRTIRLLWRDLYKAAYDSDRGIESAINAHDAMRKLWALS